MRARLGQLSDADVRLLRVFMVVVECGGLSAAEMELNIGRSTISRHLKDLETRLGLVLCRRGRAGFSLTSEGQAIYQSAQRMLKSIEDFRHEINDLHRSLKGQLVVAMFDKVVSNPQSRVHQAIADYAALAPQVMLDIQVAPLNAIEKGVLEGQYHLGIVPPLRRSPSLHYAPLFEEVMHLYCAPGNPLFSVDNPSPEQVQAQPYAGLSFASPNMDTGQRLGLQASALSSDQEGIATLIRSGHYVGFLPDHYAQSMVQQGWLKAISAKAYSYNCQFCVIHRKSPKPSRLVQHFLDALREHHQAAQ